MKAQNPKRRVGLEHHFLQEENDWLRSVLRLAEAHIKHEQEELRSLQVIKKIGCCNLRSNQFFLAGHL